MVVIKEDYIVEISSVRSLDGEKDEVSIKTVGNINKVGDKIYITYNEYSDNNPEVFRTCIVKIEEKENTVILIKNGARGQTKLIWQKGQRHYCPYYIEYGMINVGIFTNDVKCELDEDGGKLYIKYSIDVDGSSLGITEITVSAKRKSKKEM